MLTKILILLSMIFLHIVDDYYLQGVLANLKQKSWWKENAPHKMYKYDYIVALIMHSFSWSFSIMLVPTMYILIVGGEWYPLLFIGNVILHALIDNLKANYKAINLITDQLCHLFQITYTWLILVCQDWLSK